MLAGAPARVGGRTCRGIRQSCGCPQRGLDFLVRVESARIESAFSRTRRNRTAGTHHRGYRAGRRTEAAPRSKVEKNRWHADTRRAAEKLGRQTAKPKKSMRYWTLSAAIPSREWCGLPRLRRPAWTFAAGGMLSWRNMSMR